MGLIPSNISMVRFKPERLKAVIFDVDGTLYRKKPLQLAILACLVRTYKSQPGKLLLTVRFLRAYRKAQEILRRTEPQADSIGDEQLRLACKRTGIPEDTGLACVDFWMCRQPLTMLRRFLQPGLLEFLRRCKELGIGLGVVSDYPADEKVNSLGLSQFFKVVVSAQESAVGVFKPHPRGLQVALRRLDVDSGSALYIGDRVDVDTEFATAAGVRCVIVGRRPHTNPGGTVIELPAYNHLHHLIFN
jgi:putative hydrolase of the HAD superfamily